ncbi:hypothetical protein [Nostoc sp.]
MPQALRNSWRRSCVRYQRRTFLAKLHHNPSVGEIFAQLQAIINPIQRL